MSLPIARNAMALSGTPSFSSANNPDPTCAAMIAAARICSALDAVYRRQQVLERNLRVHYPTLRTGEILFPEWDDFDFAAIEHRGYRWVVRELTALQNQLRDGRKFERSRRYRLRESFLSGFA